MQPEGKSFEAVVDGRSFVFETGRLAGQAGGAVTLRLGDTMVFAAATMSSEVRAGIDFFPLSVDYEERLCRRAYPRQFPASRGSPKRSGHSHLTPDRPAAAAALPQGYD